MSFSAKKTGLIDHSRRFVPGRQPHKSIDFQFRRAVQLSLLGVFLLIGILSGTYSSVFNAAPLLVVWENREWANAFRRKRPQPA